MPARHRLGWLRIAQLLSTAIAAWQLADDLVAEDWAFFAQDVGLARDRRQCDRLGRCELLVGRWLFDRRITRLAQAPLEPLTCVTSAFQLPTAAIRQFDGANAV